MTVQRVAAQLRDETCERGIPLRNLDGFVDHLGVFHPIRASSGYNEAYVRSIRDLRQKTGETAADQQLARQFDRWTERREAKEAREQEEGEIRQKIFNLQVERDSLREAIDEEPAARYTNLVRQHGRVAESGLIPLATARRHLPSTPGNFRTATVTRNGRQYVRWEYALDVLGQALGYHDSQDFRDAIEHVQRDRQRLAKLDSQIREARSALRRLKGRRRRRNPTNGRSVNWLLVGALAIVGDLGLRAVRAGQTTTLTIAAQQVTTSTTSTPCSTCTPATESSGGGL